MIYMTLQSENVKSRETSHFFTCFPNCASSICIDLCTLYRPRDEESKSWWYYRTMPNSQSGPPAFTIDTRPIPDRTLLGIALLKSIVLVSIIRCRHSVFFYRIIQFRVAFVHYTKGKKVNVKILIWSLQKAHKELSSLNLFKFVYNRQRHDYLISY